MRMLFVLGAAAILGGCAMPLQVAGHTGDYREVFKGQGTNTGLASNWEAVLEPSNVRCTATATPIGAASWRNDIRCGDGRTATVDTLMVDAAMSRGSGMFSDGTPLTLIRALDDRPQGLYREFLSRQPAAPRAPRSGPAER